MGPRGRRIATVGITYHAQEEWATSFSWICRRRGPPGRARIAGLGGIGESRLGNLCPVAGEVTDANPALADEPEKLNEDPYGEGWLVKLKLSDAKQVQNLMTAAEYQTYVGAEK